MAQDWSKPTYKETDSRYPYGSVWRTAAVQCALTVPILYGDSLNPATKTYLFIKSDCLTDQPNNYINSPLNYPTNEVIERKLVNLTNNVIIT